MRMLDDLTEHLDDIERTDAPAYKFIESILIQKDERPDKPLSQKQFGYLVDLHNRYGNGV